MTGAKVLQEGPHAYSDLAVLPGGTIICLHETGLKDAQWRTGKPFRHTLLQWRG